MQKHLIYYFLCVAAIFACSKRLSAQQTWKESLLQYITRNLAKTDGGYGWDDQPDSHLEPTFAVVGILNDINKLPTDRSPLILKTIIRSARLTKKPAPVVLMAAPYFMNRYRERAGLAGIRELSKWKWRI
jgi:prenyltransferase beta subunit